MKTAAIIPARMASTRFPGKPLADLCGKPIIQWVYERASEARLVGRVVVATCDQEIAAAVGGFGGEFVMTSPNHRSGTDRVAEAAADTDADVVVNVQGDEPLIDPVAIDRALEPFNTDPGVLMTSLMAAIDRNDAMDPNVVKVVVDLKGDALYFSRSPVPYERNVLTDRRFFGHVGLYAYRRDFLLTLASLEPTPLERAESLEQLRVLEHGFRIRMVEVNTRPLGVDTPEDLERARLAVLGQGG